jgi:nicotinamide-nucleotide amidase
MNAEIVAVGSEMLTPQKVDTNSLYLTDQLNSLGIEVVQKTIVGDERSRLANLVRGAIGRSQILIVTGGLGPTEDDVTRDAVCSALGRGQHFQQDICDSIAERFRRFNRTMAEINKRQAFVIDGAEVLPNDRGSAPGQWLEVDGVIVMLLPGPPKELTAIWELQCLPRLQAKLRPQVIRTRFYRVAGLTESEVDQLIAPVYTQYLNPSCTILAASGDIQVHFRARCDTELEADTLLHEVGSQIEALLGQRIFTHIGEPLEVRVGSLLAERDASVAVVESCTGGMLAERLTEVPGSSKYFVGGLVTYSNDAKVELAGVDAELVKQHGPVSDPVARAMAEGVRRRLNADYALSITCVAGPDGGTEELPVGTVFIGLATPGGTHSKNFRLFGDRGRVRTLAVQAALDMLRLNLINS